MAPFRHGLKDSKTVSLKMAKADHEMLGFQAEVGGVSNSGIIHLLMEAMRIRCQSAVIDAKHAVWEFPSSVEAFLWLIAHDSGLVEVDELAAAAWYAKTMAAGQPLTQRLQAFFDLINRRYAAREEDLRVPTEIVHEWTGG